MAHFSERDLKRVAGRARLQEAERLVETIDDLYEDEWSLAATVQDADFRYLAMLHHGGRGPLSSECECKDDGPDSFCAHSVAVGLYYLT